MRRSNNNVGSRGPLMTDHLHDLELELELLKRKRQLIQHQQNEMLYRAPESRSRYEQPEMFNNHFNEPQQRNFSHLYDESIRDTRPFASKRRAEPWAASSSDRFDGPMSANKKSRPAIFPSPFIDQNRSQTFQRSRPMPSLLATPSPLMSLAPRPRPSRPRTTQHQNSMRQNQGARPPPMQTTSKRNIKQFPKPGVPQKRSGPIKSVNSVSPRVENEKEVVLSSGVEPSHKVRGRLELALGNVVKEIKAAHASSETTALFASPALARLIKQTIRDRVRSVMVGKVVGSLPEILAEYRKTFPPSTDVEILEIAAGEKQKQEKKAVLAIELLEEGNPEEYFKKNMNNLLKLKLGEMIRKMEKVYNEDKAPLISEILEKIPEVKKAPEEDSLMDDGKGRDRQIDIKPHPKEVEYDKWMSLLIERKLPQLLAKYKNDIIKILDLDQMYRNTRGAIIINANNQSLNLVKDKKQQSVNLETSKDDPELPQNFSYYAKVHANPSMPKRKLMQEFLNEFKPKTIKRHKKNFNLLFVGFSDKADYDRILEANQTKIGNATLHILGNTPKQEDQNDNDVQIIDEILTPQIDDQISELLSSIKKADEDATANLEDETMSESEVQYVPKIQRKPDESGNDSDVQEVELNGDTADVVTLEDDEQPKGEEANGNMVNEEVTIGNKEKEEETIGHKVNEEETMGNEADEEDTIGNEANEEETIGHNANIVTKEPEGEEANGNKANVTIEDDVVAPLKSGETKGANTTPAKPVTNVTPAKPAANATPAKPAANATPAKPGTNPTPAKPATNATPAKPAANATPAKSGTNPTPAKPVANATPAKPAANAMQAKSGTNAISAKPGTNATPAKPVTNPTPAKPAANPTPAKPVANATPAKSDTNATPAKPRAPATPSAVRTRRASRLTQNN